MNTMLYKGYAARIEYSEEDKCLVGHLAGIRDIIGFHADNVADLRKEFEISVDDYLEYCATLVCSLAAPRSRAISAWALICAACTP